MSAAPLVCDVKGPHGARWHVMLAHGAGGDLNAPVLQGLAARLAAAGVRCTLFNFAYRSTGELDGRRRPPPRIAVLAEEFRRVIAAIDQPAGQQLVIGGKSMGGRAASLIADDLFVKGAIAGLVCLGYPFHPPKQPDNLRTTHLKSIGCPMLIVQGTRDAFGGESEVPGFGLDPRIQVTWIADGDHDLKPRRANGSHDDALGAASRAILEFLATLS